MLNCSTKGTEFRWAVLPCQQLAISTYMISKFRLKIWISWERLFSGSPYWQLVGSAMPGLLHYELCIFWVVSTRLTTLIQFWTSIQLQPKSFFLNKTKTFSKKQCMSYKFSGIGTGFALTLTFEIRATWRAVPLNTDSINAATTSNSHESLSKSQKKNSILQH